MHRLTPDELRHVLEHVAQAGFDPTPHARAGGRLTGLQWQGRILRGNDHLLSAEVHYLRHVIAQREWPVGTTLSQYIDSIQEVVCDARSGVVISEYEGVLQLSVVCLSGSLRGPDGDEWILVDYRIALGYWTTAFQPSEKLEVLQAPERRIIRWLRRPRSLIALNDA